MARRTRLSQKIITGICENIVKGCFPHVAAGALAIPKSTFYLWMSHGREERKRRENGDENLDETPGESPDESPDAELNLELLDRVEEAQATARFDAECRVFGDDPKSWLRLGPGRGDWTERAEIEIEGHLDHSGGYEIPCPASRETIAAGLAELEAIGVLGKGSRVFRQLKASADDADDGTIHAESNSRCLPPPTGGNGRTE